MVQHAFVVDNHTGEPYPVKIDPYEVAIFRDDQNLVWKITAPGWGWSKTKEPIQIANGWTGTIPEPVGPPPGPGEFDRRLMAATGPGPNMSDEVVVYTYTAYVTSDPNGAPENDIVVRGYDEVRGIGIDPDIGNQPQP